MNLKCRGKKTNQQLEVESFDDTEKLLNIQEFQNQIFNTLLKEQCHVLLFARVPDY